MTNGQLRRFRLTTKATGAVIYLRVSTMQQSASGLGMEAQLAKCQEHCARQGIPVLSVHTDEAVSGKDGLDKRPGLRAVIAAVEANPGSVVVVYSLSRLGRSQRLIWTLLDDRGEYALPLASATEPFETATPMGRAMLGMLGVWAQLEADLVSERTVDAMAALAKRGVRLGAPKMADSVPVGTLNEIKEMYASGRYSYRQIAADLNARGVPTSRKGGKWWPKTIRVALVTMTR